MEIPHKRGFKVKVMRRCYELNRIPQKDMLKSQLPVNMTLFEIRVFEDVIR